MRKLVTVVTLFVLFASVFLSACSDKSAGESGDDTEYTEEELAEFEEMEWTDPGLSWKQDTSPVSFTAYIDHDWYPVDTWGKDEVSQEITRRTGVSLEVTKSSDPQQLQVLLAADELPDLIFTDKQVERFYNSDLVWPWDELIKKYAPEFMHLIDPVEIVNNTAPDGHFYTLKTH